MPKTHRLKPHRFWYTFATNPAALRIKPGDTVIAPTRDAGGFDEFMAPLPDSMKQTSAWTEYRQSNPCLGPIVVDGAQPGDALAVHIKKIKLNRPYAWSRHNPNFGFFTGEVPGKLMFFNEPIPRNEYDWDLDLKRMVGTMKLRKSKLKRVEIPLHPFIGSIGVAPRYGRVETTLAPGEFGGNMDCVETKEGTTLHLPVFVKGGYLAFGDVHAAQGDGEICGVALETTAVVTLKIEVRKKWPLDWPRLEDKTHLMTTGSTRPLDDCVRVAHYDMVKWLVDDYKFDRWEAFQLLSQVGTMRVGNVVDPRYTVVVKFPKKYLP